MSDIFIYLTLGLLILSCLLAVLMRNRLKAVISLAVASALLTIFIFMMGAPLAAVFELSVCAGLITAIFISTISLTHIEPTREEIIRLKRRIHRYIYLPVIVIVILAFIGIAQPSFEAVVSKNILQEPGIQQVIWKTRQLDIAGQIIIILAGVFGVVILFREEIKKH